MACTLRESRADLDPAAIDRTVARMRQAFTGAMTAGYEHRIAHMTNDPGDRHVLAGAGQASDYRGLVSLVVSGGLVPA
jgi:hypothetical protein